jgi:hypothetical protein
MRITKKYISKPGNYKIMNTETPSLQLRSNTLLSEIVGQDMLSDGLVSSLIGWCIGSCLLTCAVARVWSLGFVERLCCSVAPSSFAGMFCQLC